MTENIEIKKVLEHYEIHINNEFYCSCESWREVQEEIESLNKGGN